LIEKTPSFFSVTLFKLLHFLFHVIFAFRSVLTPRNMFAIRRVKVGNAHPFLIKLIEKNTFPFFPSTLYFVGKSRQFLFHVIFVFRSVLTPSNMFAIRRVKPN